MALHPDNPAFDRALAQARDALRGSDPQSALERERTARRDSLNANTAADIDMASPKQSQRADILRHIERELAVLKEARSFLAASLPANHPQLRDLDQAEGQLSVLLADVQATTGPVDPGAIRRQIADSIKGAESAISAATSIAVASGSTGLLVMRMEAQERYNLSMARIERTMGEIMRQDAQGFAEADAFASRYGIDGSAFTGARSAFGKVAETDRKKGDRVGALVADGLNAKNTADYWQHIADETGDADAQRKADHYRKLAEQADRASRDAVKAEVTKEAAGRGIDGTTPEGKAWVESETDRRHQQEKIEKINEAVATGQMTKERGEEMKTDVMRALNSDHAKAAWEEFGQLRAAQPVAALGMSENSVPPYRAPAASAETSAKSESATQFTENTAPPASITALDTAIQREAVKAGAAVKQDTSNAAASDEGQKVPAVTPAVKVAETAKSSVVI